jgi:alkylation response protein AidB-like acyl-CoA dehydrogenase
MTLPNRDNPYDFDAYLARREQFDYYRDDPFIQRVAKHYTGRRWSEVDAAAREISPRISFRWREMAEAISRPERHPALRHFDGHRHRIDRIVRPLEAEIMEREVFGEALFSEHTHPWVKLVKMFLLYQNAEACISCPVTCTEGLVAVLDEFADSPELERIRRHCKEGIDGSFGIGAQYLSEIQGGSDVPANLLEAVREGSDWRLYGTKFFCSAVHADYAVVTAKPQKSEAVAMFVVPSWLPGNRERQRRNGCTIDRLKWKLGTSELPTAEITFDGAVAYPVGPLDRGLANVVGIVLTLSRLTIGLSGAAGMTRAAREVKQYAGFREAFGQALESFPMVSHQFEEIETAARRTTAGAFRIYREFIDLGGIFKGAFDSQQDPVTARRRFNLRELIMLQKITAAWDAAHQLRLAMSLLGGQGVIEDFSSLPRLFRDAVINELWEGPRNVLLTQIHRDLQKARGRYPVRDFVRAILSGGDGARVEAIAEETEALVTHTSLTSFDEQTRQACKRWDALCHRLFHAYQDQALAEVENN